MKLKQIIAGLISGVMMLGCVGMMPEQPEVAEVITAKAADYVPRTTAPTSDNANYFSGNIFYTSGYGMPNCTCYAWGRAKELLGYNPPLCTRNAQYWYGYNDGFARGSEPKLGAIACWDHSGGGHVAVVEAIDGDTVWLSESSWGGDFFNYTSKNKNNMGNCGFSGGYFQGYIYIGDWSDTPQGHVMSEDEAAGQTIPDGDYWIRSELTKTSYVSTAVAKEWCYFENICINNYDGMPPEKDLFHIEYKDNGFYTLTHLGTGRNLNVAGGNLNQNANVETWPIEDDVEREEFAIEREDKGYRIRSRANSFYMDVIDAKTADGTTIQCCAALDDKQQLFRFIPKSSGQTVADGDYWIKAHYSDNCYFLQMHRLIGHRLKIYV